MPAPVRIVRLLTARGDLDWCSAVDDGEVRCIVVRPGADVPRDRAAASLAGIAGAYAAIRSPHVPAVIAHTPDQLVLGCDAITHLGTLLPLIERGSVPYPQATALTELLTDALIAALNAEDGPRCLGVMSASHLLVSESGRVWLTGFGEHDAFDLSTTFIPPVVAVGGPPTPSSDLQAATIFARSLLPLVDLPRPMRAIFAGRGGSGMPWAARLFELANRRMFGGRGPSITAQTTRPWLHRLWRGLGVVPDPVGLERLFAEVVRRSRGSTHLTFAADATWFAVDGGPRVDLSRRHAPRRILESLVRAHDQHLHIDVATLLAVGWPGESPRGTSGSNRVYVALSALRALGLRDALKTSERGYYLARHVTISRP